MAFINLSSEMLESYDEYLPFDRASYFFPLGSKDAFCFPIVLTTSTFVAFNSP